MTQGTFAEAAASGVYYVVKCASCRRETEMSARQVVARGRGAVAVVGSQERMRCTACGALGRAELQVMGYWTGVPDNEPADWAATVEERMRARRATSPEG